MNYARAAAALNTASLALAELAEALIESEAGEREVRLGANPTATTPPPAAPAGAAIPPAPPELPPSFDELPPDDFDAVLAATGGTEVTWKAPDNIPSERERVLAECPVHFTPWRVKEAGISRNGKPYPAFWKCTGKNADDSYCTKKPDAGWVKAHDPEKALASA